MLIDRRLPELVAKLQPGDLVLVTADHGCDPTWKGTDHTREHVPMLFFGPEVKPGALQPMGTYSDAGQILAHHLGLSLKRGNYQKVIQ
jgi:phosphopentomutase